MKQTFLFFMCMLAVVFSEAQVYKQLYNNWRVVLERKDGKQVVFFITVTQLKKHGQQKRMMLLLCPQ